VLLFFTEAGSSIPKTNNRMIFETITNDKI